MGDIVTCVLIELAWLPLALIALLITIFFWLRYLREQDLGEKYLKGKRIKMPAVAFAIILLIGIYWTYSAASILHLDCGVGLLQTSTEKSVKEFYDGRTQINVSFYKNGGYNSDAVISLPKKADVKNASIEIDHPTEEAWRDDFYNLKQLSENQGYGIGDNNTLRLSTSKLLVESSMELSGTQAYDEVVIKEGSEIRVPLGEKLKLTIKGTLNIERNAGINADGTAYLEDPETNKDKGSRGEEGSGGGGGGYGGRGGDGGDDGKELGGPGGGTRGLETKPDDIGMSGGNGGGSITQAGSGIAGAGGAGGGGVWIEANKIILDGYITADGGDGMSSSRSEGTGGGGGGSGGGIYISTNEFIFNGRITVNGGRGGDDRQGGQGDSDGAGGGGGGGRIYLVYNKKSGYGITSAYGGISGKSPDPLKSGGDGEPGTVNWLNKESTAFGLISLNATSIGIAPENLMAWKTFRAKSIIPSGCDLEYSVIDAQTGRTLCRINPKEASAGYDIRNCTGNASIIKLNAEAILLSFLRTPEVDYWEVTYDTWLRGFEMDLGIDQEVEYRKDGFAGKTRVSDENTDPKLSAELNKLIGDCSCRGCAPSESHCNISIRFKSQNSGSLQISNPDVSYTN